MKTILIVGLGNPGKEFISTRHNIGREIVEAFRKKMDMPEFRFEKKWNSQISEGKIGKVKVALLLPDTMMNNSEKAVAPAMRFFKAKPADMNLLHDDADIVLGRCKLSFGKNAAGHKGVESVIRALKTKDFWRFRIGIAGKRDIPAEKLVLKKWAHDEMRIIKKIIAKTTDALKETITEGPKYAMNKYNQN